MNGTRSTKRRRCLFRFGLAPQGAFRLARPHQEAVLFPQLPHEFRQAPGQDLGGLHLSRAWRGP